MGTIKDFFDSVNMVKFYKNTSRNPFRYFRVFYMKIRLRITARKLSKIEIDNMVIREFGFMYLSLVDKIWFPEVNAIKSEDTESCTIYIDSAEKHITITATNNESVSNIYTTLKYSDRLPVSFSSINTLTNCSNDTDVSNMILTNISIILRNIILSYLKEYIKLI